MRRSKLILVAILFLFCAACRKQATSPPELQGMWRTEAPSYSGKFLKFDGQYIVIINEEGEQPQVREITQVSSTEAVNGIDFVIRAIGNDGVGDIMKLEFRRRNRGEITLSHPKNVTWRRVN